MAVHARGEDRKDYELETVHGCTVWALLVKLRKRLWRCILMQYGVVGVLGVQTSMHQWLEIIEDIREIYAHGGEAM
jgi:hypothetical protein